MAPNVGFAMGARIVHGIKSAKEVDLQIRTVHDAEVCRPSPLNLVISEERTFAVSKLRERVTALVERIVPGGIVILLLVEILLLQVRLLAPTVQPLAVELPREEVRRTKVGGASLREDQVRTETVGKVLGGGLVLLELVRRVRKRRGRRKRTLVRSGVGC